MISIYVLAELKNKQMKADISIDLGEMEIGIQAKNYKFSTKKSNTFRFTTHSAQSLSNFYSSINNLKSTYGLNM